MAAFLHEFEWDPLKAKANLTKHGVHFEQASHVFQDPLAVTIPDDDHSENELRWITLGKDGAGSYLVVVHTFREISPGLARVRLISARRPTRPEVRAYEENR